MLGIGYTYANMAYLKISPKRLDAGYKQTEITTHLERNGRFWMIVDDSYYLMYPVPIRGSLRSNSRTSEYK